MPVSEITPVKVSSAMISYHNDYLYISGGSGNTSGNFYRYSLVSLYWENITNESYPNTLVQARSTINNNYLYILFGTDSLNFHSTISRVNLYDGHWQWEELTPTSYYLRYGFSLTRVLDLLYLFGGYYVKVHNDFMVLDVNQPTPVLSTYFANYTYPEVRSNHALRGINSYFYLFGGLGVSGYLGDLWQYDLDTELWLKMSPSGPQPSARHLFASDSFGDALLVWGGEGKKGLLSDIHIFNSRNNQWNTIVSQSSTTPSARKGACAVFQMPYLYIYGGETQSGYSNELWVFDLQTYEYTLISNSALEIAYANCQLVKGNFFVLFGLNSNGKNLFEINVYNLTSNKWSTEQSLSSSSGGTQGISIILEDKLLYYGGRDFGYLSAYKTLNVDYNGTAYSLVTSKNPYNMAWAVYQTRLYYSNGGSISVYRNLVPLIYDTVLAYIDFNTSFLGVNFQCSPGTWLDKGHCMKCPPGYYSDIYGNSACKPCGPGRFNDIYAATSSRQCYPCPEGTFNQEIGKSYCLDCEKFMYCPLGSILPGINSDKISLVSVQPSLELTMLNTDWIYSARVYLSICLFPLLLLGLIPWIRKHIKWADLYQDSHYNPHSNAVIKTKTKIGAFFTAIFLIIAVILLVSAFLEYYYDNINELQSLDPLVVLEKQVTSFSTDLNVTISFLQYSEECVVNNTCSSQISIATANILPAGTSYSSLTTCTLSSDNSCTIKFSCKSCTIDSKAYIYAYLHEEYTFAAGISVEVSANSAIPNSQSSISLGFFSQSQTVLAGPMESSFYFGLNPSLFTSEAPGYNFEGTGYNVFLDQEPVIGSQTLIDDLAYTNGVRAYVYLSVSQSGLNIYRYQSKTFIAMIAALLGSIMGVMGAIKFALQFTEWWYLSVKRTLGSNKMVNRLSKNRFRMRASVPHNTGSFMMNAGMKKSGTTRSNRNDSDW